jgi:hypothetical protein
MITGSASVLYCQLFKRTLPRTIYRAQGRYILKSPGLIAEILPDDIKKDLEKACALHQRALSDYSQCTEFSRLMSDLLARLEDVGCFKTADKVMTILLDCNPKTGAHCEKSTIVSQITKKLG